MHEEVVKKTRRFLIGAEEFLEDVVIVVLSICVIFVLVACIGLFFGSGNFITLTKIKEISMILFPWVGMLAVMLIFRELWLIRRIAERAEIRKLLELLESIEEKGEHKSRRGRKK